MKHVEPPSTGSSAISKLPSFLIGKNAAGSWVVRDRQGLYGGLFVSRAEALRYAMFENGHRPQAVVMVPDTLELEIRSSPSSRRNGPVADCAPAPQAKVA